MYKIVIFNVGGAFSAYAELNNKKVVIDLGSGNGFSPVKDFLKPLIDKGNFIKNPNKDLYIIDQLFLSHLDNDHISDYIEFRNYFFPDFMTCPNKNINQNNDFKINDQLIGEIEEAKELVLKDMSERKPESPKYPQMSKDNPLISIINEICLYYIKPKDCELYETLRLNYANNISLVLFVDLGHKTMLFPGDISKEGMECLINTDSKLRESLSSKGVDYLIAPHHGLQTSFSEHFFRTIRGYKTRLNIIPEKVRTGGLSENRSDVDSRYYSENYSSGLNNLNQQGIKTSRGHIFIKVIADGVDIRQCEDINDIIPEFVT